MGNYRILIVEDQRDVRRLLRTGLETLELDLEIIDVPSGEEGQLLLTRQPFDVLVADVRLPGISGLELKKRAQINNPDLKLILITGLTDPDVRQQIFDAGADAFFFKPLEMADFLDAVERCLGVVGAGLPPLSLGDLGTQSASLAERLAGLRQLLNAVAILLVDERGRVAARAGELPVAFDEHSLVPYVLAAFSATEKVTHYLGGNPSDDFLFLRGADCDLIMSRVGPPLGLVAILPQGSPPEQLGIAYQALRSAVQGLLPTLKEIGIGLQVVEKSQETLPEVELESESTPLEIPEEIETLFDPSTIGTIKPEEVDAFWDQLIEDSIPEGMLNADAISYEQARQLGLTPDEDPNETEE
jgi:CheY-like chemotaxis protein